MNQREGATHVNLRTVASQLGDSAVRCVVTFDQSHHREAGFTPDEQRAVKVCWLRSKGLHAFYYVSHAPFLFACSDKAHMIEARGLLLRIGVPANRIQVPE